MKIAVLDIGGTAIKYCLYDDSIPFKNHLVREMPTHALLGGKKVIEQAIDLLNGMDTFDAVGISSAGQIHPETGTVIYATDNIPGYTGMRIREILEDRFCVPVMVENDVNAAALGEAAFGAGRGQRDFLCLTYGTGIGGAFLADGKIYHGSSYSAIEAGHMLLHAGGRPCTCGNRGCYEMYASATALVCLAQKSSGIENLNGRRIFSEFRSDIRVQSAVYEWMREILWGLASLTHLFNPSCIILGGGIMSEPFIPKWLNDHIREYVMNSYRDVKILPAMLGNTAGLQGMIYLVNNKIVKQ